MSVLHKYASVLAKAEGGMSNAKLCDVRQILKLLKDQHKSARKGHPSILLALAKEAKHK